MQYPVGATIGFSCDGVYYSLEMAHDADFIAPGTPLEAVEMRWFFDNPALDSFELLGGLDFNKRRWTDTTISASKVAIISSGLRGAIENLMQFVVHPSITAIQQCLRPSNSSRIMPFRHD